MSTEDILVELEEFDITAADLQEIVSTREEDNGPEKFKEVAWFGDTLTLEISCIINVTIFFVKKMSAF